MQSLIKTASVLILSAVLTSFSFGDTVKYNYFAGCELRAGNGCTSPYVDGSSSALGGDPTGAGGRLDGGAGAGDIAGAGDDIGSFGLLASSAGVTSGSTSAANNMIGDFFGGGYSMRLGCLGSLGAPATNIAIAGADRRYKFAENNSPFPTDRLFFNYSHFHNALLTVDGRSANLNRGTFGLEKTFFDGLTSVEIRAPLLSGLNSNQVFDPGADNVTNEFGNVALAFKLLLVERPCFAMSTGLGIVLPTADDTLVSDSSGAPVFRMDNEAVYLQPFIGMSYTPNDRVFWQSFAQLDIDTGGNTAELIGGSSGVIRDQTLLFLDTSIGYWLFHDRRNGRILTGLAPIAELHYSTTTEGTNVLTLSSIDSVSNPNNRQDILNITGGLRMEVLGDSYLTLAGVAPLREGSDKLFDAEFGVQFMRKY
jgi:hypothetical protein